MFCVLIGIISGVEKMKKITSLFLCGVMLTSFVLCGCQKPAETADTGSSETSESTTVSTEPAQPTANMDNYAKVTEFFNGNGAKAIYIYPDGIRGGAQFFLINVGGGETNVFTYTSNNGDSIKLTFNIKTATVDIDFDLKNYSDGACFTGKSTSKQIGFDDIESFIDDLVENKDGVYEASDRSALNYCADKVKNDIPIYYSRLIACADKAFPEIGLDLEDLGLDLGDKYRAVDPTQASTTEYVAKNECKFVDGICTDCGKIWPEYMYKINTKFDKRHPKDDWHAVRGQKSSVMFDSGKDYVEFSSSQPTYMQLVYEHEDSVNGVEYVENCAIIQTQRDEGLFTSMAFSLKVKEDEQKNGAAAMYRFSYWVTIEPKSGKLDEALSSFEAFKKNATVQLRMLQPDGSSKEVSDEDVKYLFGRDGSTFYTKDEILEKFWDDRVVIFSSIDASLKWYDTSLTEAGIKWKDGEN